jgi:hypothetical protein
MKNLFALLFWMFAVALPPLTAQNSDFSPAQRAPFIAPKLPNAENSAGSLLLARRSEQLVAEPLFYDDSISYVYDAQQRLISETTMDYFENLDLWLLDERKLYDQYDAAGNVLHWVWQRRQSGNWVNFFQYTFTYNAQNQVVQQSTQSWNSDNNTWWPAEVEQWQYNAAGVVTMYTSGLFDRTLYEYDAANRLIKATQQKQQNPAGSNIWNPIYVYLYAYNTLGQRTSETFQLGNGDNYSRDTFAYDAAGRMTEEVFQEWDNGWENTSRFRWIYPDATTPNPAQRYNDGWSNTGWTDSYLADFVYNAEGKLKIYLSSYKKNGAWSPTYRLRYYYSPFSVFTVAADVAEMVFEIYPNPSTDQVFLKAAALIEQIQVVDVQGKIVEDLVPVNDEVPQIMVSHLPKGTYWVRIKTQSAWGAKCLMVHH